MKRSRSPAPWRLSQGHVRGLPTEACCCPLLSCSGLTENSGSCVHYGKPHPGVTRGPGLPLGDLGGTSWLPGLAVQCLRPTQTPSCAGRGDQMSGLSPLLRPPWAPPSLRYQVTLPREVPPAVCPAVRRPPLLPCCSPCSLGRFAPYLKD